MIYYISPGVALCNRTGWRLILCRAVVMVARPCPGHKTLGDRTGDCLFRPIPTLISRLNILIEYKYKARKVRSKHCKVFRHRAELLTGREEQSEFQCWRWCNSLSLSPLLYTDWAAQLYCLNWKCFIRSDTDSTMTAQRTHVDKLFQQI